MLFRTSLIAIAGMLALGGCPDPEMTAKVAELEKKLEELEARGPAGRGAAAAPDPEQENEARERLAKANKAAQDMDYDTAAAVCKDLADNFGSTQTFRRGKRVCDEVGIIGKDAMELDVSEWFQGEASLAGEPTLLVFWEEWCPHCKREVPKLQEMHTKYEGRMKVVGLTKVNRSSTDDSVRAFIKEKKVTYPIGKEKGNNLSQHYGVRGVPAAALVKDGKVVWRGHPARLNDDALSKLL